MKDPHYGELRALAAEADLQIEQQQNAITRAERDGLRSLVAQMERSIQEDHGEAEAKLARVVEIAGCYRADEWAWEMAQQVLAAAKGEP